MIPIIRKYNGDEMVTKVLIQGIRNVKKSKRNRVKRPINIKIYM